ncbi:MAG: glycosyltransferase family 4 protein [Terriglobales bacterium]
MARQLRIAHLDGGRDWRGGQQQMLLLARALRGLDCEQVIVARPGVVTERLRGEGFAVHRPGARAWRRVRECDIGHAHDGRGHSWLLRSHKRHGRVLSRRVAYPIRGWVSRWRYRCMDLVIAVSLRVREQVLATGLTADKITVIADGVDFNELRQAAEARARIRARAGLEAATPLLVCVGAFTPEKGVGDAVEALVRLPPGCVLVLTGTGPGRPGLERRARELGVASRVRFVHGDGTPAEWVAAAEVLLMPSREEGLGSAGLLAMGLGVPVVATRVGGIPELIEDGVTGLLVDAGDVHALAHACAQLLGDGVLAQRLAAGGAQRARERYDSTRLAETTMQAYRRLLETKRNADAHR